MTMREFIRENREELDKCIARAMGCEVSELAHRNDSERLMWIQNDEDLYRWARSNGVRV